MLKYKDLHVLTPSMLQLDFMLGVSGTGGVFNVPWSMVALCVNDDKEDWVFRLHNDSDRCAFVRIGTSDVCLDPGCTCEIAAMCFEEDK